MNMEEMIKRGPGRPPRQVEGETQRRRRSSLDHSRNLKLHVPESTKDSGFEYRWIKNTPGRVSQLTKQDDYDIVTSEEIASEGLGSAVERSASKSEGGTMVLVRKPKEFYDADKRKEQAALDALEDGMRRGSVPGGEGLNGPNAYVPGGSNIVNGR
jgi:hypothetical protein